MCCDEEGEARSPPSTPPLLPSRRKDDVDLSAKENDVSSKVDSEINLPLGSSPPSASESDSATSSAASSSTELFQETSSVTTVSEDEIPDSLDSLSLSDDGAAPPQPTLDRRANLLEKLLGYCDDCSSISDPERSQRRLKIIGNLFRYTIAHTPTLLVRAQPFHDVGVRTFLVEGDLATEDLESLWDRLKFSRQDTTGLLGPEVVRNAIVELMREPSEQDISQGRCLKVLAGWVWREADERELTREEWDDLYDFVSERAIQTARRRALLINPFL
jgi:hypothetical protein